MDGDQKRTVVNDQLWVLQDARNGLNFINKVATQAPDVGFHYT